MTGQVKPQTIFALNLPPHRNNYLHRSDLFDKLIDLNISAFRFPTNFCSSINSLSESIVMLSSHKTAYSFSMLCKIAGINSIVAVFPLELTNVFSFPLVKLAFNLELLGTLNPHYTNKLQITGIEKTDSPVSL